MVQEPPTRVIQVWENTHPSGIEQLVVGRCLVVSEKREGARYFGRCPTKADVLGVSWPEEHPFEFDEESMIESETRDTFIKNILKYTRARVLFANPFAH